MRGLKSRTMGLVSMIAVSGVPQLWAQQDGGRVVAVVADTADTVAPPSLEARLEELDQKVRILERLRELAADSAAAAAKDRQSATANAKDGFSIKSADSKYTLRLRGYVQADSRFYPSSEAVTSVDNLLIRRARPILEGAVGRYFEFRIMP